MGCQPGRSLLTINGPPANAADMSRMSVIRNVCVVFKTHAVWVPQGYLTELFL